MVLHYDRETEKAGHFIVNEFFTIVRPPLWNYQVFHAKLCLLCFESFLRVVVTSANLIGAAD